MMVLCEPKHVGAAFIILTILIIYEFYNLYASVGHDATMKFRRISSYAVGTPHLRDTDQNVIVLKFWTCIL